MKYIIKFMGTFIHTKYLQSEEVNFCDFVRDLVLAFVLCCCMAVAAAIGLFVICCFALGVTIAVFPPFADTVVRLLGEGAYTAAMTFLVSILLLSALGVGLSIFLNGFPSRIGIKKLDDKIAANKANKKFQPAPPPGLFALLYEKFKSRTCFRIDLTKYR